MQIPNKNQISLPVAQNELEEFFMKIMFNLKQRLMLTISTKYLTQFDNK
jgi:hypothetical protein